MSRQFRVSGRRFWFDVLVIFSVIIVLVGNHVFAVVTFDWLGTVESPARNILYSYPAMLVHLDTMHLIGNLIGYLLAAILGYYLCARAGVARWYYASVAVLFVVVPPITSHLIYTVYQPINPEQSFVVVGFSNVVGGLIGFLFVAVFASLSAIYSTRSVSVVALVAIGASIVELAWVAHVGASAFVAGIIGAVLACLGLAIVGLSRDSSPGTWTEWQQFRRHLVAYGVLLGIHSALLIGLLPRLHLDAGVSVVVFGHLVGLFTGLITAIILALVFQVFPTRRHVVRLGFDPDTTFQLPLFLLASFMIGLLLVAATLLGLITIINPQSTSMTLFIETIRSFGVLVVGGWGLVILTT